ncbi:MAG: plastocyanin/azurin family copper-binding protein [Devosiaceae bacterium]|nr:plastocyanin/azurin family copper-binding protein [Devosiaceae bacterium]
MFAMKSTLAIAALTLASLAQPAFAQVNLQVFMWDVPATSEMAQDHKMGDGANRLEDTMGISLNATTVPAGKVTFNVVNVSTEMLHEMVVSKLDDPDAVLPYEPDIDRVDESRIGTMGEVEAIDPGVSDVMTLDMQPGTYVLYCNLPGHYSSGMWMKIEVI